MYCILNLVPYGISVTEIAFYVLPVSGAVFSFLDIN
jgi:hypothetical protein